MQKLTRTELAKVLTALGRESDSVYHAKKHKGKVYVQFVGDREETTMMMPRAKRAKKTTTAPVEPDPKPVVVVIGAAPGARKPVTTKPEE